MRLFRSLSVLSVLLCAPMVHAEEPTLVVGKQAPWIAGLDLDGKAVSLGNLLAKSKTRGAVVQFWATWCHACKDEMKELAANRSKFSDAGISILLVDILDEPEAVAKELHDLGLGDLPLVRDSNGFIAKAVGIAGAGTGRGEIALPLTLAVNARNDVRLILRESKTDAVSRLIASLEKEPVRGKP